MTDVLMTDDGLFDISEEEEARSEMYNSQLQYEGDEDTEDWTDFEAEAEPEYVF